MIKISLTLKEIEITKRKSTLKKHIQHGNKIIRSYRMKHKDLSYYWGITLPFERKFENDVPSTLVRTL